MGELAQVIGGMLQKLRKNKDLSQEEMAELADVHHTYVGQIERGEKNITIETLEKFTDSLEITLEDFFSLFSNKEASEELVKLTLTIGRLKNLENEEQKKVLRIINDILDLKSNSK